MSDKNKTIITPDAVKVTKNHVVYLLDGSGSMHHCVSRVRDMVNAVLDETRRQAEKTGIPTVLSVFGFSNELRLLVDAVDIQKVKQIGTEFYDGRGTNMRVAVRDAIGKVELKAGEDTAVLFNVYTDGEETGYQIPAAYVGDEIARMQKTDRWTFTFQVPPRAKVTTAQALGVDSFGDNIREWDQTSAGIEQARDKSVVGTQTFFAARSVGATKVDNYYAKTDASALTSSKIAKSLDDVSGAVRVYEVKAEGRIDEFVKGRTGGEYVVGQGYYLLMKKEVVQGKKKVLIREKGKAAIWGGDQARALIGLSPTDTQKVEPGNHSKYDIFVQSTSVNRILPRGTFVAVDTKMSKGLAPTWDHVKVAADAKAKRAKDIATAIRGNLNGRPRATAASLTQVAVDIVGEAARGEVSDVIAGLVKRNKLVKEGRSYRLWTQSRDGDR